MKKIYILKKYGRMGNALYRWAHLIAYARDNGAEVWDLSKSSARYFKLFPMLDQKMLPVLRARTPLSCGNAWLQSRIGMLIRWFLMRRRLAVIDNIDALYDLNEGAFLDLEDEVVVSGFYYDAGESLQRHAAYIRELFSPPNEVMASTKNYIKRFEFGQVIGVHIRRGDYKEWLGGKYFFELDAYHDILRDAARLIEQKAKTQVSFLIFSDDSSIDASSFPDVSAFRADFSHGRDYDWYLMSLCDFIIAPRSTYSGWASFFGEVPLFRIDAATVLDDINQFRVCSRLIDEDALLPDSSVS